MGTLYLVATPLGNLEDLSPRAIRTLREASLVAAEDTRHSQKLLNHFGIETPITSYFEHNKLTKLEVILRALERGDVALISDAGTPAINDPGYELVRAAIQAGHPVSPVPGPSAPIAALAASGLPTDSFLYLGYLPRKSSERREKLASVASLPYTLIIFETPHRLVESLQDILSVLGDRPISACRELTKLYEQFVRGGVSQVLTHFTENEPRGEFVLVIEGQTGVGISRWSEEQVRQEITIRIKAGHKAKQISNELSLVSGWQSKEVYSLITVLKR